MQHPYDKQAQRETAWRCGADTRKTVFVDATADLEGGARDDQLRVNDEVCHCGGTRWSSTRHAPGRSPTPTSRRRSRPSTCRARRAWAQGRPAPGTSLPPKRAVDRRPAARGRPVSIHPRLPGGLHHPVARRQVRARGTHDGRRPDDAGASAHQPPHSQVPRPRLVGRMTRSRAGRRQPARCLERPQIGATSARRSCRSTLALE